MGRPFGVGVALALSLVLLAGVAGPEAARAQFSYTQAASLSSPGANPNLAWGDYDGDGTLDLVVLGQGGSTVYDGNGSGGFSSTFSFNGFDNAAADWGDFDGDGDLDLVVTGFEAGQGQVTKVYENTGGGNFSTLGAGIVGLQHGSASWGDYDGDGDQDLLVSGIDVNGANITRVYRNDGGGTFVQALDGGEQGGPSAWGDFDGDGDLDFIVTGFYSPLSIVWRNLGDTDGDGEIEFGRVTNSIPGVQDGTVAWGDADADGAAELAISGNDGDGVSPVRVFDYDNGGFVEEDAVIGLESGSVDWGDADSDGALDLLITGYNGEARFSHLYTNDGDGTSFSFADDSFPAVQDGRAAFGDYDDDGILDVAITGNASSGNLLEVWSGSASRSNRSPNPPSNLNGTVDGFENTLALNWQGASDRSPNGTGGQPTPASALTYNVFVRPQGSTDFLYPPEASPSSGERWVVRRGNVGSQTGLAIDPDALSEGTYEWSVQALDYNYAGSSFPTAGTFTIARTDLGLSVSAVDASIPQGGQTTVTLTLSNEGGSASAGGSTVTVDLPVGLSVTGSSGDGQFDSGVWTVNSSIASGSSASMDLTVQLDEKAEQTLNAGLTETETIDANDANHTAQTTIDVTEADLVLTSRGAEAEVGAQATPTFTLENTSSTTDATDVIVDVSVPSGLTVQGSTGDGSYSGGTWTVGTVGSGQEATLDLTVQKDAASLQTLPAQLGGTGVVEPDGASTTSVVAPVPYGSEQALTFDGSDDYVNAGSDIRLDDRSFTISFWARRASSGSDHFVVGQGPTAAGNQSLHVGFRDDGRFTFAFFGDDLNTATIYTGDGWHHWAVTFAASTNARRIYRDGVQVASDNAQAAFQGTGDFFVGQRALSGGGRRFDGTVDQLRVWHAAFTQEQVQARMNRTIDLSSAVAGDLVAAYRFDTGSGSTAYDVARGHHGTLQDDPQWTDPSEASVGRESAALTDGSSSATVGPSGSSVEATLTNAVAYCSDQTHTSVDRALHLLGFETNQLRRLPSDDQFRLEPEALRDAVVTDRAEGRRPFCVIANAGTTNTGAVDPLPALVNVADAEDLWLHVDGAYGAPAVVCERGQEQLTGLDRADSLTMDPHKWLFQPFEIGGVLVRDERYLRRAFRLEAEYLEDAVGEEDEVNFSAYGIQLTHSFRALKLWMTLKVFGRTHVGAAVERGFERAEQAERLLRERPEWTVVTPAQMGIVTFRCVPDGRPVLRLCPINPRTTADDLRKTVDRLDQLRQMMSAS